MLRMDEKKGKRQGWQGDVISDNKIWSHLRTSLCKTVKHLGQWKFSTPLQILHAVRHSGGMHKNALFEGRSTLVAMVTTTACSRPGASFSYKNVAKKEWNVYFSISSWIQHNKFSLLPSPIVTVKQASESLISFPMRWVESRISHCSRVLPCCHPERSSCSSEFGRRSFKKHSPWTVCFLPCHVKKLAWFYEP